MNITPYPIIYLLYFVLSTLSHNFYFYISQFLFSSVNGGYSDWSSWSACTATCGGGSRMRNRKCNNPAPANEGKTCFDQQLGSEMESEACNIEQCEGKT